MKNFLLLLFSVLIVQVNAQDRAITGKVTDAEGAPLYGVNIVVKDAQRGAITNEQGEFSVNVPQGSNILIFSYIGYDRQEVAIGDRTQVNVTMGQNIKTMDEVVVIGYGTKKKRDVLGSVSSVDAEELTKVPSTSFLGGLQGRATGLRISSSSGVPGAGANISIRGLSSLSLNTSPLWIIDGMPVYSGPGLEGTNGATRQDPMSLINPNDIESVEVLKDAAATSIYGSRGSNGVIIITTKSGKKGRGGLEVNYNYGITDLSRTAEDVGFTNTEQWFDLVETARRNSNGGVDNPYDPALNINLFRDDPKGTLTREEALAINTDWFDRILQTGNFHDATLSATHGFEKGNLYASVGYRRDESVLISNLLERYTARLNMSFEPFKNFRLETRLNVVYTANDRVKQQVGGGLGNNNGGTNAGFGNANRNGLPWYPIYDSNHPSGYWNPLTGYNLVAMTDRSLLLDEVENYRGLGGIFLEYSLPWVKGLSVRSELSVDFIQNNAVNWIDAHLREEGSFATDRASTRQSVNYNLYAKYNRSFGEDHGLSVTVGTESQRISQYRRESQGQNLTGTYQQLGNPRDFISMSAGLTGEEYLLAYFGRADYKFKDKYLVGLSFRRDGSSKFNEEFRFGFFPAISFGWIASDEDFLQIPVISLLKLRGSYGQTGNNGIPSNRFVTTYSNRGNWRYGPQDFVQQGTRITNIGVPSLTWETTSSYDVGIDYGFLDSRISGSLAFYFQDVTDLLLRSPLAVSAGLEGNSIWGNVGDMQNWGWEFEIHSTNINRNGFKWSTDFNITTNGNKVVRLTPDLDRDGRGLIQGNTISRTGGRLRAYFMAEDAGVDPERGVNLIYEIDRDRFLETGETVKTGRKIPATLNNLERNRLIHEDRTSVATFFGGINNVFEYKGFDLSAFFVFAGGNYIYDYEEQRTTDVQQGQVVLRTDMIGNTWTPENPNAKYPELRWQGAYDWAWDPNVENPDSPTGKGDWVQATGNYKNETVNWSKYLHRGDYIRLTTLQLGYNVPNSVLQTIGLKQLRVFVTGSNIWTQTDYNGWDPESGGGRLPALKIWAGGVNVKF